VIEIWFERLTLLEAKVMRLQAKVMHLQAEVVHLQAENAAWRRTEISYHLALTSLFAGDMIAAQPPKRRTTEQLLGQLFAYEPDGDVRASLTLRGVELYVREHWLRDHPIFGPLTKTIGGA
jgi:hypothetical protein